MGNWVTGWDGITVWNNLAPGPMDTPTPPARQLPTGADVPKAATVNSTSETAEARQLTLAADGSPIPFGYGRDRIGALILNVLPYQSYVVVQCLWGYALDSIESVQFNDATLPAGATVTSYTGTQTAVDATMQAAFSAQSPSITYTDTLEGFAYSVFKIPASSFNGGLSFSAIVKWRKVYDPRTATTVWSDNPALALADFIVNTDYGAGLDVDWDSVETCADWNDTDLGGGEKQRLIGWTVGNPAQVTSIIETLRLYASVFLARRGATLYMIPDAAAASVATYSHAAGDIQSHSPVAKRDMRNSPTKVEVVYTDTDKLPWRDRSAFSPILPGAAVLRLSSVRLNGIQRYSQAYREAIERINKLSLNDLSFSITVFDKGIRHEVGDVVTVTLPFGGITDKLMRVVSCGYEGPGLWRLDLVEYDPNVYSSTIQTTPTYEDTVLPSPGFPPVVGGVSAAEEIYQNETGLWASRGRVTITPPSYLWLAGYQVEVYEGTNLIDSGYTAQTTYTTPPVQDGLTYSVRVRVVSNIGAVGDWTTDTFVADGKLAIPGDVPSITGFEVGGDVYLAWDAAVDLDIWRYELRWGTTSDTWASAQLLDRVDALRYISKGVLTAGVRRIFVKAIDSIGQYSTNAAYCDVTVTIDPDALRTIYDAFDPGTPTDMAVTRWGVGNPDWYVTEHGVVCSTLFPAGTMGGYTNALASYQSDGTNTYQTDIWDAGVDLTGDWSADIDFTNVSGSAQVTLQLCDTVSYPTFTDHTTLPVKTTARYARIKVSGTGEFKVLPGSEEVTCYAVTRKEYGVKACAATGTNTVTLDNAYFAYRSISLTPVEAGAVAVIAVADNIVLDPDGSPANSFDIYTFDASGARVASDVSWKFEGV
jgi:hypothetical protein